MRPPSKITSPGARPRKPPTIPGFISEPEQARRLGESLATRRRNRRAGIGPPYVRYGRTVIYPEGADIKYLNSRLVDPEAPVPVRRGRPHGPGRERGSSGPIAAKP